MIVMMMIMIKIMIIMMIMMMMIMIKMMIIMMIMMMMVMIMILMMMIMKIMIMMLNFLDIFTSQIDNPALFIFLIYFQCTPRNHSLFASGFHIAALLLQCSAKISFR